MNRVVSVKLLGPLGRLAGHRQASLSVAPSATVNDVLEALAATYGRGFAEAIFRAPGEAHTHLRIFLNEAEAHPTDRIPSTGDVPEVALLLVPGFEGGSDA